LVKPKKRIGKPPSKRRDTRCEVEEVEVWEMPKSSVRKGWYTVTSYENECYKHVFIIVSGTNGFFV